MTWCGQLAVCSSSVHSVHSSMATDRIMFWYETICDVPGMQSVLLHWCIHSRLCLHSSTVVGYYHDEHDLM